MNIGIVTTWFERGAAYVSRQYLEVLTAEHSVYIYCRGGEKQARGASAWDKEFVTWGPAPTVDEASAVDLDHFSRWLTEAKIDCVFFNEQRFWPAVILCAERGILNGANVLHYREDTVPFFSLHDFLVFNSLHHKEVLADHPQSLFIPWGTKLSRFCPSGRDRAESGRVTFFHSGGMNPYRKGADLVLAAFEKLDQGPEPAHLVLHTQLPLKDLLPAAVARAKALLARGSLTLIERSVEDLAELYRLGDVCVYPTRHEGLGLTIAESLASGLPILVTDQAPVNEHADGKVVRVLEVEKRIARWDGDYWPQSIVRVNSLTAAMQELVDYPDRLPCLKREARAKAESSLDWERNARHFSGFVSGLKLIDSDKKRDAMKAAMAFEERRWGMGLRNYIGWKHPGVVRAIRRFRR